MHAPLNHTPTGRTMNPHATRGKPAMTENDDHRIVSRDNPDGSRLIVSVRRDPETDAMTDDELINQWQQTINEHRDQQDRPA
jgi:hypothetical protein